MNRRTAVWAAALMCAALVMPACAHAAADNSVGVWKREVDQTKYSAPNLNPIVQMIMTREAIPGGLKIHSVGERKDGTKIDYTVSVVYDGKDYPVSGYGSVFDTIAITATDANHFPSVTKKGKYQMKGLTVISPDGKTMTITNHGTEADGSPMDFVVVWSKQ